MILKNLIFIFIIYVNWTVNELKNEVSGRFMHFTLFDLISLIPVYEVALPTIYNSLLVAEAMLGFECPSQ
jgi:hypothetical protein